MPLHLQNKHQQKKHKLLKKTKKPKGAEILLAAQAMVDELAGMAEDIAEMQTAKLFTSRPAVQHEC